MMRGLNKDDGHGAVRSETGNTQHKGAKGPNPPPRTSKYSTHPPRIVGRKSARSPAKSRKSGFVLPILGNDPRRTPRRIGFPHPLNELSEFWRNPRSACFIRLTERAPVVAKSLFLPGRYGPGLDKEQSSAPPRPQPRHDGPEQPIFRSDTWPLPRMPVHGQLVPQRRILRLQRKPRSGGRRQQSQNELNQPDHGAQDRPSPENVQ